MTWRIKSITVSATDETTIVSEWFSGQSEAVQVKFLKLMGHLITLPKNGWGRPYVGQLRKDCKGLLEIVMSVNGVEHRPIGYVSASMEFTFLAFATERDGEFDPRNVCVTAFNRLATVQSHKERVREITF